MGKNSEWMLLWRRPRGGQQAHLNMFSISSYEGKPKKNDHEVSLHSCENGCKPKEKCVRRGSGEMGIGSGETGRGSEVMVILTHSEQGCRLSLPSWKAPWELLKILNSASTNNPYLHFKPMSSLFSFSLSLPSCLYKKLLFNKILLLH